MKVAWAKMPNWARCILRYLKEGGRRDPVEGHGMTRPECQGGPVVSFGTSRRGSVEPGDGKDGFRFWENYDWPLRMFYRAWSPSMSPPSDEGNGALDWYLVSFSIFITYSLNWDPLIVVFSGIFEWTNGTCWWKFYSLFCRNSLGDFFWSE